MPRVRLSPSAQWITHPDWVHPAPNLTRTPVLRRRFMITDPPASAQLVLAGLGVWTATLDRVALDDAVLEPGSSEFRTRVAVTTVDLGARLTPGAHVLEVQLGEGSAHVRDRPGRYTKFVEQRTPPRLIAELTQTDSTGAKMIMVTDDQWEAALGCTTSSHWYGGEDVDARLTVEDWRAATVLGDRDSGPQLWVRASPPVRVVAELDARDRTVLDDGSVLVDFEISHAGRPVLRMDEATPTDAIIELWPAEDLIGSDHDGPGHDGSGPVDQTSTGKPIVDTYTTAGGAATWHPQFCYHGYRYVELRSSSPGARPRPPRFPTAAVRQPPHRWVQLEPRGPRPSLHTDRSCRAVQPVHRADRLSPSGEARLVGAAPSGVRDPGPLRRRQPAAH